MLLISLSDMPGVPVFMFGCHSFHILLLFEAAARMRGGFAFGGTTGISGTTKPDSCARRGGRGGAGASGPRSARGPRRRA